MIYIHIPFCESKCDYCDFFSERIASRKDAETQRRIKVFLDAIIRDIYDQVQRYNIKSIPTVYIGGGTPSVLGTDIKILLDALNKLPVYKQSELKEFTIEANPESLTEDFLAVCKERGVNRLSLGVQSFNEKSRKAVNRAGDIKDVNKALTLAKKYFQNNLSIDLITGFPYHTKDIVKEDIKRVLDFDPAHISVYSLTLEKETKLYEKVNTGVVLLPDSDESDSLWLTTREELINAGFKHYEVSNFAKPGKECKHNIRYWRMEGWLGVGPSASGTIIDDVNKTAVRYTNQGAGNREQGAGSREQVTGLKEQLVISNDQLIKEIIMMGYRYCEGPDPKWGIEKFIPNTLNEWKSKNKMLYLNVFLIDAFNELENNSC